MTFASCSAQTKGYARIMAVMVPREDLTEHRLDALEKKVDALDKKVDKGFADLRAEMRERFHQVDGRSSRLEERMMRLEDGFYALNRNLNAGLFVIVATLIGSNFF